MIGGEQSFNAFAGPGQFPLQALLTFLGWIGRARGSEAAIQFLLDQRWVLEQADHLGPDDLVKQILPHHAVIAHRTTQLAPAIRADAFVVVDLTRGCGGRGAGERVTTLLAADQALHDAGRDRAPPRSHFVLIEQFLGTREALLAHQCGYRDLDPLFARTFMADTVAGHQSTTPAQRSRDANSAGDARLTKSGCAAIGRIAQHGPHD